MTEAYRQGRKAYFAGVSTRWNPYLPFTVEYTDFISGYEAAYFEIEYANIQLDAAWSN